MQIHSENPFWRFSQWLVLAMFFAALATVALPSTEAVAQSSGDTTAEQGPTAGEVPGGVLGGDSDSDYWRKVRSGAPGSITIPNQNAAILIQSEGDNWRAWRNGPLTTWGAWLMLGTIVVLALFFALRGRIRIEAGPKGVTVERFNGLERFAHWLTASTFIILALTGLNLLYGRHIILPILGPEIFSALTIGGKWAHNFLAFPFMLGVVLIFALWLHRNVPSRVDLSWLARGGGMFVKGSHPPAAKFNAGQKLVFWAAVLGGISLSLSGLSLLFPFEFHLFSGTFAFFNIFGAGLPENLAPIQEMQLSQLWHAALALIMIAVIIAHIYIGTIGMEGAFDAMGTGRVDENWAREHHSLWLAELKGEVLPSDDRHGGSHPQPAE
ncbi:MAG: formate dehydrogenase subunit gamma [Kiloniellales bacterium]